MKKVLHIVYAMNMGGIESWLISLYRNIDKTKIQFDFLVNVQSEGIFDKEIKLLGGDIIYGGSLKNIPMYYTTIKKLLEDKRYDAVHCHNIEGAGIALYLANKYDVKSRIFHSHNNFEQKLKNKSFFQRAYLKLNRILSLKYANRLIAVSKNSGDSFYKEYKYNLVYLSIDFNKFKNIDKNSLHKDNFGFKKSDIVIGHIGRFSYEKNHTLFVDIADKLIKKNTNYKFLLVGDGLLMQSIKEKVDLKNLNHYFTFAGIRQDIPNIMYDIMDILLFPSISEGLGLVVVEAQASSLVTVCSKSIPNEAIVINNLVTKVSLDSSLDNWTKTIEQQINKKSRKIENLEFMEQSQYNINTTISKLEKIW
jgi:glycosyltransferase EpsF